jgi:hypothetical protein
MDLIEFDHLRAGQTVKISGKFRDGAGFLAVEIALAPLPAEAEIEGLVQQLEPARKQLRICGQTVLLPDEVEIKDADGNRIKLPAVKPGVMIKLKGAYAAQTGIIAKKIKLKETLEFNIEQVQGEIAKINRAQKTFQVNGITILAAANTVIFEDVENFDDRRETTAAQIYLGN